MKEPTVPPVSNSYPLAGPGTRLNGIYVIDRLIATGGMGQVYAGHTIETGDKVAIKMIRPELARSETYLALFRKEAAALHRTPHDAIVRYYLFTTDPDLRCPYLAMEFVEGESLGRLLRQRPLDLKAVRVLQRRLAAGLEVAHQAGVIHRDVSPDNIILPDNDPNRAKIIDFGIARDALGSGTVIDGDFAGKSNYVSPEQVGLFGGEVTAKSDIYSLGLTLAGALLGSPLDMGGLPADMVAKRGTVPDLSGIPPEMRPLLRAMLQPRPADRPGNMGDVAAWPTGGTAVSPPIVARSSRKWVVPAVAAAVLALGAVGVIGMLNVGDGSRVRQPEGPVVSHREPVRDPTPADSSSAQAPSPDRPPVAPDAGRPTVPDHVAAAPPPEKAQPGPETVISSPPPVPPVSSAPSTRPSKTADVANPPAEPAPAQSTPVDPSAPTPSPPAASSEPSATVQGNAAPEPPSPPVAPSPQPVKEVPATPVKETSPPAATASPPASSAPNSATSVKPAPQPPVETATPVPAKAPAQATKAAPTVAVAVAKPTAPGAFRDCGDCPEMIALPAGTLEMGSNADSSERPIHKVELSAFAVGRFPVTVGEWQLCVAAKGCGFNAGGNPDAPVHNLSWDDATQYVSWLSGVTRRHYRLPSEAEWEYAARAGTRTRYWWGNEFRRDMSTCHSCVADVSHDPPKVNLFPANAFGLHDVTGSVSQWVADCWHKNYRGAPKDGRAWEAPSCTQRVLRGGSWSSTLEDLRVTSREFYDQSVRYPGHGLRVVRDM